MLIRDFFRGPKQKALLPLHAPRGNSRKISLGIIGGKPASARSSTGCAPKMDFIFSFSLKTTKKGVLSKPPPKLDVQSISRSRAPSIGQSANGCILVDGVPLAPSFSPAKPKGFTSFPAKSGTKTRSLLDPRRPTSRKTLCAKGRTTRTYKDWNIQETSNKKPKRSSGLKDPVMDVDHLTVTYHEVATILPDPRCLRPQIQNLRTAPRTEPRAPLASSMSRTLISRARRPRPARVRGDPWKPWPRVLCWSCYPSPLVW